MTDQEFSPNVQGPDEYARIPPISHWLSNKMYKKNSYLPFADFGLTAFHNSEK